MSENTNSENGNDLIYQYKNCIWRNKKHGTNYIIMRTNVMNATNSNEGETLIIYRPIYTGGNIGEQTNMVFAREKTEFLEKFYPIDEQNK